MRTRLAIGLLLASLLVVAAPALGQEGVTEKKRVLDARIDVLEDKIEAARQREGVLTSEIEAVSAKIDALQDDVDVASSRLDQLEEVLALHQRKLDRLNQLYRLQTRKLVFLQDQHKEAVGRLNKRLIEIYTSSETSPLSVVLEASSFADMLDHLEYLEDIGRHDKRIAAEVKSAKLQMQETRNATRRTRKEVAATTRTVAARTAEQRAVRDRLAWSQRELATARRSKRETLAGVQEDKEHALEHMAELQAQSAALAARIRSAQSSSTAFVAPTGSVSASGFVWPVHGILTSGYGWRWGRMHEGIDLAVPNGTPVVASAAGTVIVAGWMGGYGNLVVVDHGGALSTAYGHNATVTVGVGQQVMQGQLIAYSGNTGHSTGPHVHFEVRVNGAAVDPMGYL
ncbi:MAG TPA: peptidoglycan DD-metalloendopeptidase family protein [Gaiellaceae bacterium]|nr:peptidoglycan DD-metalloendopeptidase family protein [Gaiellaceae bacterium]